MKKSKEKRERGREIDTTCLAGRKLPLIIPHYNKLVRESEVKFDISRWAMCILNFAHRTGIIMLAKRR